MPLPVKKKYVMDDGCGVGAFDDITESDALCVCHIIVATLVLFSLFSVAAKETYLTLH